MFRNNFKALFLISFIKFGKSVPLDYCLLPLDKGDCGLKPTPVFSYYKSGSRCEIEIWRGCPTFNKFPDEFHCSHHCIGKLWERTFDNNLDIIAAEAAVELEDDCKVPMTEGDCGEDHYKYTFIDNMCIKVKWKGCASRNVFDDEADCEKACGSPSIKKKLEGFAFNDMVNIDHILFNAMKQEETGHPVQQLKMQIAEEDTTEPKPEATSVAESVADTTDVSEGPVDTTESIISNETISTETPDVAATSEDATSAVPEESEVTTAEHKDSADLTTASEDVIVTTPETVSDTTAGGEVTTVTSTEGDAEEVVLPE